MQMAGLQLAVLHELLFTTAYITFADLYFCQDADNIIESSIRKFEVSAFLHFRFILTQVRPHQESKQEPEQFFDDNLKIYCDSFF